ncbi:MAG: hypothetical protein MUF51_11855 [Vicinamibacteria bacterium]|nr:hypothetical protein [Vicinamibacteria bacterium]
MLINGQRVPLIGPNGIPLPSTALVTMAASRAILNGDGIPVAAGGRGTSLADEVVIDPNEAAIIAERIAAHNRNITDICKLAAIPLVDINVFSQEIATTGRMVGGHLLNNALLTGGVYSYDGIHPTELGYALIANEWIQVINKYGTNLSLVNLLPYLMAGNTGTSASTMTAGIESPAIGPLEFSEEAHRALLAVFPPVDQR